jgi:hypothetical protein
MHLCPASACMRVCVSVWDTEQLRSKLAATHTHRHACTHWRGYQALEVEAGGVGELMPVVKCLLHHQPTHTHTHTHTYTHTHTNQVLLRRRCCNHPRPPAPMQERMKLFGAKQQLCLVPSSNCTNARGNETVWCQAAKQQLCCLVLHQAAIVQTTCAHQVYLCRSCRTTYAPTTSDVSLARACACAGEWTLI